MKKPDSRYAALSLTSTLISAIFSSIHHIYEIGYRAFVLVLVFMVFPSLSMWLFQRTRIRGYVWVYGLLTIWLVAGLGLFDGLWNHILRPLGFQFNALMSLHGGGAKVAVDAVAGGFLYEWTGILTFISSMFAAYYGYQFVRMTGRIQPMTTQYTEQIGEEPWR